MTSKLKLSSIDLASYAIITIVCAAKIAGNAQLTSIVTDEIQYKEIILGLKDPHLFNPVFNALYSITKYANEGWYLAVRLINLMFVYASTEAVRRICLLYKIEGLKRLIVYAAMLCTGIITYMLNIMPECMYIAGIYWTMYLLLKQDRWTMETTVIVSSVASSLSLIKPHAILIYPIIVTTYICGLTSAKNIKLTRHIIVSLAIFTAIRWGLGWLLSGKISLGLFGGLYETLGNKNILESLQNTFYVINRHAFSWILIMPFIVTWFYTLVKGIAKNKFERKEMMLHILACGALTSSIIVFSMFTSSVNTDENMQILRIHLRYYSFIIPIVVISALTIENEMAQIVKSRELVMVNGLIIIAILTTNLVLNDVYTIRGNWIDSPALINITSANRILSLSSISAILMLLISLRKTISVPIVYTALLLVLAEMRQWDVSYKAMKNTKLETKLHSYIELKTEGQAFEVLVKGENYLKQTSTRNEMINCIKIAMLQTKRTFRDVCIKDLKNAGNRYLVGFTHLDYGMQINDYCKIEEIRPAGSKGIDLFAKKDFKWKDVNINSKSQKFIALTGFYEQESWGRWAKDKRTAIKLKKRISGDIYIRFKARSLIDSKIRIGNKVMGLNQGWKDIEYRMDKVDCLNLLEIEYIGKKARIKGRSLTYAIKDLELINNSSLSKIIKEK